jgi:hypothetical protein
MSPSPWGQLCRRFPDFVVSADAATRCGRERIPTAIESAIRARFVRDSFHSLITGLPPAGNAVNPAMCGSGSRALRAVRVAPFEALGFYRPRRNKVSGGAAEVRRERAAGPVSQSSASRTHAASSPLHVMEIQSTELEALRAGGRARTAFAGHGGSSYPALTRCARLQALHCTDRKAKRAGRTLKLSFERFATLDAEGCWIASRGGNVSHRPIIDADFLLLSN